MSDTGRGGLRVLHVVNSLPMGGAERLLVDLARPFAAAGMQYRVIALESEGDKYGEALRTAGVEVHFLSKRGIRSPARIIDIAAEIRRFRPHIVHAHLYPAILWTAAAKKLAPVASYILTEHNTLNRRMDYAMLQPLEHWLYRQYDAVAAISEAVRDTLLGRLGSIVPRIAVIPNGVDIARFHGSAGRERSDTAGRPPGADFLVVMAARFNVQKDHATLLRAMKLLPSRFRLALAGEGEEMESVKALAAGLGIAERVDFLGARRDIPEIYAKAQAYVQSSNWEGFGLAAIEAMAAGLPVVASKVPGLAEVVGGAGILFPPADEAALAQALANIAEDDLLAVRLSSAGRLRAAEYSIEACARAYGALYQSLVYEKASKWTRKS
jgi:glycosyltransferase involved in cell wall biosynthesis